MFGNGSDDVITSGLQKHELFVFQVNKSTTDEEVKSYLERKIIIFNNIYLKSNIPMYIKIRVQWTYNDIHNNHRRYTL